MPNGISLQDSFNRARLLGPIVLGGLVVNVFFLIALWSLFGAVGLAADMLILNILILITTGLMDGQISSLYLALHGTRDESKFSQELLDHIAREVAYRIERSKSSHP